MFKFIILQLLIIGLVWGQDCTADDGTEGVELWGNCYSIEYTTEFNLSGSGLTGSIPPEIGNLTNLNYLGLLFNQLTGEIPGSICDLNIDWSHPGSFSISNNQLCPPYPSCLVNENENYNYMGTQDTSDCP